MPFEDVAEDRDGVGDVVVVDEVVAEDLDEDHTPITKDINILEVVALLPCNTAGLSKGVPPLEVNYTKETCQTW